MAQLAMLGGMGPMGSLILPIFSSVIGMFMQPGQKEEQGKLNDLKVSSSAYGEGIAIVYGTMRVPGNMFWATDFEEEKKYINSKGKDVTNKKKADKKGEPVYTYYANFAMGLCEGPVGEVLRVWADSNLIYDRYNSDDEDVVGPGFSNPDDGSGSKGGKGGKTGKKGGGESSSFNFAFHNGSEGQSPEAHMVEKTGAKGTPAHRGLCYLYFKHFALADFGNRIPTITAEIAREHDRKPKFIYFKQLVAGGDVPEIVTGFGPMFFDPVRLRAYTVGANVEIRAWDLTKQSETHRVRLSSITGPAIQVEHPNQTSRTVYDGLIGGYYEGPNSGGALSCDGIVGIAASGDIIGWSGATNSRTLIFIDPDTWIIKARFGKGGLDTHNSTYTISAPTKSTILTSFDPILQIPLYYTLVQSFQGDMYAFDDQNRPMGYYNIGGLGSTPGTLAPGLPNSGGSSFYINNSGSLLFGKPAVSIKRLEWLSVPGAFVHQAKLLLGPQDVPDGMGVTPQIVTTIYTSAVEDDETGRYSTVVYPILGSESIAFIEVVAGNTVNPEKNGTYAVKVDYAENISGDYTVKWREKFSDSTNTAFITQNGVRDSVILSAHKLILRSSDIEVWEIDFTLETVDIWYVPDDVPAFNYTQFYFPIKGAIYQEAVPPAESGGGWTIVEASMDRLIQKKVTPAEILKDLADRVNIGAERVDVSRLNSDTVTGYVVQQPKAARRVAEDLMRVFFFDIVESDYTLKAVSRSQSVSAVTVPQRDLGLIKGNTGADNAHDYYKETQVQEIDLPRTVMVSYIDAKDDYQNGSQHWRRPSSPMSVMQSRETLDINFPIAMNADFAKQIAQKITYSAWAERSSYEFSLPWKYMKYDPTDVMTFVMDDGLTFISRMGDMDLGQDFSIKARGTASTPSSYISDVVAQGNGTSIPVPSVFPPHVRSMIFDVPYFEDTDSVGDIGWAYYWGLKAFASGFKYGALSDRVLPNGSFNSTGQTAFDVVWGTTKNVVPPPPISTEHTDTTSRITLYPAFDFSLNAGMMDWVDIADADWPSHDNTLIINGEIIYFKNSTVNADLSVTVDTLIRGARGTRDAAYQHYTVTDWVFRAAGIDQEMEDFTDVDKEYLFRPVAPAVIPAALPISRQVMTGSSHKPWAPNDIRRVNTGADITISWQRASRLGGALADGTGSVPSLEGDLQFEVYILSSAYDHFDFDPNEASTYIRKFGPNAPENVVYTAAELATDGLTQDSTLHLIVLQRNQFVGRGFYGWASLIL